MVDIQSLGELDIFLDQQIERNRKGDFVLRLLDPLGRPVQPKKLSAERV